jgi:hypothetical protein
MRFQPGQSGNPAGRPPGSLNKKTLAAQAMLAERAEEIVTNLMDRSKNGEPAAMRLVMDRLLPTGRNRPVAIELPVIKTPEDAELALAVITDELAAGKLTIGEASALITLIDRMLRLAERMWKFQQARLEAGERGEEAPEADAQAPQTAEKPRAPLYSPVNSGVAAGAATSLAASAQEAHPGQPGAPRDAVPLPRAA